MNKRFAKKASGIREDKIKLYVLNDDVLNMVKHAKAIGSSPSYYINDAIQLFNCAVKDIDLPDFSYDEKSLIANCLCGSEISDNFIHLLDVEVSDLIADGYKYFNDEENGFTESHKNFIAKIHNLNYMQRVKLIHIIQSEIRYV